MSRKVHVLSKEVTTGAGWVTAVALLAATVIPASPLVAQNLSLDNVPAIALTASSTTSAVSIDAATGNVILRSSTGNLNECTAPNTAPVINSFGVSPSSVQVNSAFSISWSSTNTTSCTPSGGTGTGWAGLGTLSSSGTQNLTAPATPTTVSFTLTCTNGTQNVNQQTSLTVTSGGGGGGGGSCTPPSANGSTSQWNSTLGSTWPSFNDVLRLNIGANQWVALQFTASASATQFGTFSSSHYPGDGDGAGQVSISASNQAGCFTQSVLGTNCISGVLDLPGVSWSNQASAFACKLTPGTTYFMNVQFPVCAGTCGRDFGNIQQLRMPGARSDDQ